MTLLRNDDIIYVKWMLWELWKLMKERNFSWTSIIIACLMRWMHAYSLRATSLLSRSQNKYILLPATERIQRNSMVMIWR